MEYYQAIRKLRLSLPTLTAWAFATYLCAGVLNPWAYERNGYAVEEQEPSHAAQPLGQALCWLDLPW